jgi:hypothetical protein
MPSGQGLSAPVARSQASAVPSEGGVVPERPSWWLWRRWAVALDAAGLVFVDSDELAAE